MKKNTSKSYASKKIESSVIELSESVHWSRRCYAISFISVWNVIGIQRNSQPNDFLLTYAIQNSAAHWRCTVVLESK